MNTINFQLPSKLDSYLHALSCLYGQRNEILLQKIVVNSVVSIQEERTYDNWDGGTYGHAVTLSVLENVFLEAFGDKENIQNRIREDINEMDDSQNEHISDVFLQMQSANNENWRGLTDIYQMPNNIAQVSLEVQQRIWGNGTVRIFLSHISKDKVEAARIKSALNDMEIAAFVAHEDIKPTKEWHEEIENALFSMNVLVALLTPEFHKSDWTDQEIGVAIGRGVPLISILLGIDPYGLMGKWQGIRGCRLGDPDDTAHEILKLLCKCFAYKLPLFENVLSIYAASYSFDNSGKNVEKYLALFEQLTFEQVKKVMDARNNNGQNRLSRSGDRALLPLIRKWTGDNNCYISNDEIIFSEIPTT
jgi:hypothetical protein